MIVFPNCKINLGLDILRKRPDGFHDLQTVFYPVNYYDILEIIEAPFFQFQSSGLSIGADYTSNLCVRAYHLLKEKFPDLPAVQMYLFKNIPMGAGLGGGSSDGAFALKALARHFDKRLSEQELIELSVQLGSDCPFFIVNRPVIATGRGEIMESLNLSLAGYTLVMVHTGVHVSTKQAFSGIVPQEKSTDLKEQIMQPVEQWKNTLINQFEASVGLKYPVIPAIKQMLYNQGAVYASMTGSGSVVYGIFNTTPVLPEITGWKYLFVQLS